MIEADLPPMPEQPVEAILREELARGDRVLSAAGAIIEQMLENGTQSLFSEEILARIGGMVDHLARQLLSVAPKQPDNEPTGDAIALVDYLKQSQNLLRHCHALAVEGQLTTQLQARSQIDPVLSPLLQAQIASDDQATASAAMAALAAQARFVQTQQRMELPLADLPGDLFHEMLLVFRDFAGQAGFPDLEQTEEELRGNFDEGRTRLALLAQLISGLDDGATEALTIDGSGVALFLTGLAQASAQTRDLAVLSTDERQLARLALALRAGGLSPEEVAEQFVHFHPEISLPETFGALTVERAQALLATGFGLPNG